MKVSVIGAAGGIGQPLSLLLKTQLPAGSELTLHDLAEVTPGVAVDLQHIPTDVKVTGAAGDDPSEMLQDADVVLICAGVGRKPGMTRADLFNINAGIAKCTAERIAKVCPKACVCIITNPVNTLVPIVKEVLKKAGVYDKNKLFGVTTLDVIRSQAFIGELKGVKPEDVKIDVIGGHSGVTILPLLSQVEGVEFTEEEIATLTPRIQNAGTEVVEAKVTGSATLSMAQAACRLGLALVDAISGKSNPVECAYVDNDKAETDFFSQPVRLGKNGVEEILDVGEISAFEKEALAAMQETLAGDIKKGAEFEG